MSVKNLLRKRAENRNSLDRISSRESAAIAASASMFYHESDRQSDLEDFREWMSGYREGYENRWDVKEELRAGHHDRYQEQLKEEFGPELSGADLARSTLRESSDIDTAIESARSVGPEAKLDFWRYFARKGGKAAQKQLRYREDGSWQHLSDEQFDSLRNGESISHIVPSGERHHVQSVAASLDEDPADISDLTDPGNIRIMTKNGHRYDPVYGHGGDTRNQTTGDVNTVERDYQNVAEQRYQDEVLAESGERAEELGIAFGIVGGSISAIARYQKLRLKPWRKRSLAVTSVFAGRALEYGTISYVAARTRDETAQLIADGTFDAAEASAEAGTDLTTDLVASGVGIEAAVAVRSAVKIASTIRRGKRVRATVTRAGKNILVVGTEETFFILLGVAGDAALPIPEPHMNLAVNGLRISYRLGKVVYNYRQNVLSRRECRKRRLSTLHTEAIEAIP